MTRDVTAPDDPDLSVSSGDQQTGFISARLDAPLSIVVRSHSGKPRAGVVIHWSAEGGGSITPDTTFTNDSGKATAIWVLGPGDGPQSAHAVSDRYHKQADFHATAQRTATPSPIVVMQLETPDHSGQTVHPDYVAMPSLWTASPAYLVATPYTNGDAGMENPSLFAGSDGFLWTRPIGVHNPLVTPDAGYLSDPDALYVPESNELWIYFRAVTDSNVIRLIKSSDGVHFTPPEDVVTGLNHTVVSPTVVHRSPTEWTMWSVNANIGCAADTTFVEMRRSVDGVRWSNPTPVKLAQPGYSLWHIDVQWIPSLHQYWAIYNVKTPGNCSTPALFLATSPDGATWTTYPSPVLRRGVIPEFSDIVYRSTFSYDAAADSISFWYSGAHFNGKLWDWRSAFQQRGRGDLFADIARTPSAAVAALYRLPRPGVPLLIDAP